MCMYVGINIQKGLHVKACVLLSTPESQIQLSTLADLPGNKAKIGRKSNVKHQYLTFGHTLFTQTCSCSLPNSRSALLLSLLLLNFSVLNCHSFSLSTPPFLSILGGPHNQPPT